MSLEGGKGGRGGRGGMTVMHIVMAPHYLNSSHVLRNNVQVGIRLGLRRTMVRNYYVRRELDSHPDTVTNKLPGAGVQTSYVHSSINASTEPVLGFLIVFEVMKFNLLQCSNCNRIAL